MQFADALNVIIELETGHRPNGGYTNDPDDPGGETKWGISKRAYPHLDIKNLSYPDAFEIYQRDYWERAGCDKLFPSRARILVFDCAVNQGVRVAQVLWKRAARYGREQPDVFMAYRSVRYAGTKNFEKYGVGWNKRLFRIARESEKLR